MKKYLVSLVMFSALAAPLAAYAADAKLSDIRVDARADVREVIQDTVADSVRSGRIDAPALLKWLSERSAADEAAGSGPGFQGVLVGGLFGALGGLFGALSLYTWLAYLGATALIVWLARRPASDVLQDAGAKFWPSAGHGVLYALFVPMIALMLVMSVAGAIPGAAMFLGFFNIALISSVLAGVLLGAMLVGKFQKRSALRISWGSALGGVVLYLLLGVIPFVGWIISLLFWLAVLGAIGDRVRGHVKKALA